jgi:hypothetical protein
MRKFLRSLFARCCSRFNLLIESIIADDHDSINQPEQRQRAREQSFARYKVLTLSFFNNKLNSSRPRMHIEIVMNRNGAVKVNGMSALIVLQSIVLPFSPLIGEMSSVKLSFTSALILSRAAD